MKKQPFWYIFLTGLVFIGFGIYILSHQASFDSQINTFTPTPHVLSATDQKVSSLQASVTKVIDGDTVVLSTGQKLRYIGMNAPELEQPYGKEAKDFNSMLVQGKSVTVVFDQQKQDQYGRLLGYIYAGSVFVNLEILKKGWSVAEDLAPNSTHKVEFAVAEQNAKKLCQGLWSDLCIPVPESCVKIANIQYDAAGIDDQNLNDEWVEIVNNCTSTINFSGWLLKDSSATNSYIFTNISLASQQSIQLHSGCGTNTIRDLYWQCPMRQHAIWNNSGDEAMLFDSHGKLLSVYKY